MTTKTCGVLLLMATTLLNEPEVGEVLAFGILIQAKSRAGSHISVTPFGRYPPMVVARLVPTFCEVRRIRPIKVPFAFLAVTDVGNSESFRSSLGSAGEPLPSLHRLLLKKPTELSGDGTGSCGPNLKIWMVSVADETQRSVEVTLNDMLKIREGMEPLRNWYSL